jgi:signal transduction histidine kinase
MAPELAQIAAGLSPAATFAAATAIAELRSARRRSTLNQALHELRRPLQSLALATGTRARPGSAVDTSLEMAAAALERLDRQVNGDTLRPRRGPLQVRSVAEAAVERWRARARRDGKSLALRWRAGEAHVLGDRFELAQALDNLIANALEHGGERVVVSAGVGHGRLRLAVRDERRCDAGTRRERGWRAPLLTAISGRRRRGHGLRVVRRTAGTHGGGLRVRRSLAGWEAVVELPLLGGAAG